jgi:penicillin-binding protein 2
MSRRRRGSTLPRRLQVPGTNRRGLGAVTDEEAGEQKTARIGLRLTVTAVVVLGLFTVMAGRLWSLQVLQTKIYRQAENTTATQPVPLTPLRGLVFARDGQLLIGDQIFPVVTLSRSAIANDPAVIGRLAALLGMTVSAVRTQINDLEYNSLEPVPILVGATPQQVLYVSEHKTYLPGVSVDYESEPSYPDGYFNPTLLGGVGDITATELKEPQFAGYSENAVVGQSGVQSSFQKWLRGTPGSQTLLVDPSGDVLGVVKGKTVAAIPGDDVVLSVDLGLQHELDKALAARVSALRVGTATTRGVPAPWAAAVVEDPQNGQILAMSSVPTDETYALSGYSPPGSTFKLATATAALNTGLISPYTQIDDPGYIQLCSSGPNCKLYNSPGESPAGPIDVTSALARSDDVFFYTLGADFYGDVSQYGKTPIQEMAALYGLGKYTDIDLPGEGNGQVDNPSLSQYTCSTCGYYEGDEVEMAFGQGATEITALQLANEYATFANGGTRYQPQVASAIVSPTGKVAQQMPPIVEAHVPMPAATRQAILSGLEGAVYSSIGTAQPTFAGYNGFPIAGKTGTATTSKNAQPNGLFVAFGPCTGAQQETGSCSPTQAQYVVAVIIDQAGYGASTAAPVARTIFDYLNKHPVEPFVVPAHPAA